MIRLIKSLEVGTEIFTASQDLLEEASERHGHGQSEDMKKAQRIHRFRSITLTTLLCLLTMLLN
jgi:hypothetical protein